MSSDEQAAGPEQSRGLGDVAAPIAPVDEAGAALRAAAISDDSTSAEAPAVNGSSQPAAADTPESAPAPPAAAAGQPATDASASEAPPPVSVPGDDQQTQLPVSSAAEPPAQATAEESTPPTTAAAAANAPANGAAPSAPTRPAPYAFTGGLSASVGFQVCSAMDG